MNLVKIVTDDGMKFVEIYDETNEGFMYDFPLKQIHKDNILTWIYHLSEKHWITKEHIVQLLYALENEEIIKTNHNLY